MTEAEIQIPKKGKAAVVVNEGPDFHVEVQEVDVPEPGELATPCDESPLSTSIDEKLQPMINSF
jgi:hypothetical protein